jgi:hypothetical protein
MWDTEVYPGESRALRSRQALGRIERIQGVLAIERAAYDAGWGALTRYPPEQYRPQHYFPEQQRSPLRSAGAGASAFMPEMARELAGIHSELRSLRREVQQLRTAPPPMLAQAQTQLRAMPPLAAYPPPRDFVGEPVKVSAQTAIESYRNAEMTVLNA